MTEIDQQNEDPKDDRFISCSITILFLVLGFFSSVILSGLVTNGLFVRWHSLDMPPEKANSIIGANYSDVYVSTINGNTYLYSRMRDNDIPKDKWILVENLEIDEMSKCDFEALYAPSPPSETIDFLQFGYCPEPRLDVRYAILKDGTVWRFSTPEGIDVFFITAPIVFIFSLFLATFVANKGRNKTNQISAKNNDIAS